MVHEYDAAAAMDRWQAPSISGPMPAVPALKGRLKLKLGVGQRPGVGCLQALAVSQGRRRRLPFQSASSADLYAFVQLPTQLQPLSRHCVRAGTFVTWSWMSHAPQTSSIKTALSSHGEFRIAMKNDMPTKSFRSHSFNAESACMWLLQSRKVTRPQYFG